MRVPLFRTLIHLVAVGVAGCALAPPPASAGSLAGHAVPVPGGLPSLLETAGLSSDLEPEAALVALLRRLHRGHGDRPAPLRECLAHLTAASALPETGVDKDSVWLPLPADVWDRVVLERPVAPRSRLAALLADRPASRLVLGLLGLHPAVLDALASDPAALLRLKREGAEAFALFSASVRFRGGWVEAPGGAEGRAFLDSLSGCRGQPGARDLVCLMAAREGRVAWLHDTLAGLDEPRLRFALGLAEPDPSRRGERRSALAAAFLQTEPFWLADRAGVRIFPDAAWVLRRAPVDPEGRLLGGFSAREWQAALEGEPNPGPGGGPADAAWLVSAVVRQAPLAGRQRLDRLLFAGRVLVANPGLPFDDLAPVMRAYSRAPALFLTLERSGLLDAAVLRAAASALERIERAGGDAPALAAVERVQGALALLDAAGRGSGLPREAVSALSLSLLRAPEAERGSAARVAAWLDDELLARLRQTDPAWSGLQAEELLARAIAGSSEETPVLWESASYRLEIAPAWRARFRQARARQGGPDLDEAMRAARAARDARAVESAGAALAHVLRDLAYATAAATLEDVTLARLSERHQLGSPVEAWSLPDLILGRGWAVRGSLLALETGLARGALHRLDEELPRERPVLEARDRETMALSVAQMRPLGLTDPVRDELLAALRRGRERAASAGPEVVGALARDLGLEGWRREAWRRAAASGAARPFLGLSELVALGGGARRPGCDAWGASVLRVGGGLCLAAFPLEPWSSGAGFVDEGLKAAGMPDPALRVLEGLAEEGLPAALALPVLARTMPDVLDSARPADAADGVALARAAARIPRPRIRDAVASLTTTGALVPAPGPGEVAR